MNKINLLITQSNGNLVNQEKIIHEAIQEAENYAFSKLKIDWNVDILITNMMYNMTIPEDGVSGNTYHSNFIIMNIDEKIITKEKIFEMTCHELCHAARWGKNDEWCEKIFDLLIFEGLAVYFEEQATKSKPEKRTFFLKTILNRSDKEQEKILKILKKDFDKNNYGERDVLTKKTDILPRWPGYSLGYYLVKQYLEKTDKTIEEAFVDSYDDFRKILL